MRKNYRKKTGLFNKIILINFKYIRNNYLYISLWFIVIMIFYSIIKSNFFNGYSEENIEQYNLNQIKKFNLKELYEEKNIEHNNIRVWVLNNTSQLGLAGKIRDCLEKGYIYANTNLKGDYDIRKQDNFSRKDRDEINFKVLKEETQIFIHVDTINYPKFKNQIKDFLKFTGLASNVVKYDTNKILYNERDITLILGEDWNERSTLNSCGETIN
jgi:hypothetical protein